MRLRWPHEWPQRMAWIGIGLAGAIAVASPWLKNWRMALSGAEQRLILVTTEADDGLGSLRSAILTADRSDQARRILVMVPRVALAAPLPPLVNPYGIILDARHDGTELDASRVAGAALDIASPHTTVHGFRIVKAQAAVVVRASRVTLRGVTIEDSDTGVLIGDHAEETTIDGSVFRRNRVGVQAMGLGKTVIGNSRFENQRGSALWAVAPQTAAGLPELSIHDNRFLNDAGGLVLVNRPATVEENTFEGLRDAAVFASGGRAVIRANHIRSGHGFGVLLDRASSSVVYRNEIAHNCSGGVMVREARNTEVVSNDLYRNGFGIIVLEGPKISPNTVADNLIADHAGDGLLLIASSPLVRRNRLFQNAHAGVRLAALVRRDGEYRDADPLLEGNVLRGNGRDEPFRDDYIANEDAIKTTSTECSWRVAAVKTTTGGQQ
jgi:nitrous oxidase accessory protein NosD